MLNTLNNIVIYFKIVGQMMDADKMKVHYERLNTRLLDWIRAKILELEDRNFSNSLEGIQKELLKFKQYRTIEKPPKWVVNPKTDPCSFKKY